MEWLELEGNCNAGTPVAFLKQLPGQPEEKHPGPLKVSWGNAPAQRGEAMGEYLGTPDLNLQLVNLPGYSPDFDSGEANWGWAREEATREEATREEATGNLCLGSRAAVQEKVGQFLDGLTHRKEAVKRRCRTVLRSRAEAILPDSQPEPQPQANAHPTLALV